MILHAVEVHANGCWRPIEGYSDYHEAGRAVERARTAVPPIDARTKPYGALEIASELPIHARHPLCWIVAVVLGVGVLGALMLAFCNIGAP